MQRSFFESHNFILYVITFILRVLNIIAMYYTFFEASKIYILRIRSSFLYINNKYNS